MVELVVISGKGGTGKTGIVGAFAALAENPVMCDADVDAANLYLILAPEARERHDFRSGHTARIDPERCIQCEECLDWCRFEAISPDLEVDELACEGCGVCVDLCPVEAIDFPENVCGEWYRSETRFGPMIHARLGIAEENSGKLVTLVRNQARALAEANGRNWIITDGPPGIGCPVIASIGNATAVLVVSEPSVSGRHDLERVAQLAEHFQVPVMVCVNKADLYPAAADEIERHCRERGYRFVGRVPFDPVFSEAIVQKKTVVEMGDGPAAQAVRELWSNVRREVLSFDQAATA